MCVTDDHTSNSCKYKVYPSYRTYVLNGTKQILHKSYDPISIESWRALEHNLNQFNHFNQTVNPVCLRQLDRHVSLLVRTLFGSVNSIIHWNGKLLQPRQLWNHFWLTIDPISFSLRKTGLHQTYYYSSLIYL